MRNPTYLELSRHRIFYFRYRVPGTAKPTFSVKVSLQTRDVREAMYLSRQLRYAGDLVTQKLARTDMRYDEIRSVLKRHFQALLQADRARIAEDGPLDNIHIASLENGRSFGREAIEKGVDLDPTTGDDILVARFVALNDLSLEPGSKAYTTFKLEMRKAYTAYCAASLAQNKAFDAYDLTPLEAPIAEPQALDALSNSIQLHDLTTKFAAEENRAGRWAPRSADQKIQHLELLKEVLGLHRPVAQITAVDAQIMKELLIKYPRNRNKSAGTRALSVADIMRLDSGSTLSIRTINSYLQTYSSLFNWAKRNRYVTDNIFDGATVRENQKRNDEAQRDAFSTAQIETMLSEILSNSSKLVNRDYQKWGPLIGLYTGARLNEICQIQMTDVKEIEGIWCFDLNDDGDGKRLKNAPSRRVVPIHQRLIELGLLEHVESVKLTGATRLFPEFTYSNKDGYGRALGRWFNERFLVQLKIKSKDLVFHSFRHTMITRLKHAGVEDTLVQTLVGHKREGVTHQHYFKKGYTVEQLHAALHNF